jgi:hypothetical protein
MMWPPSPGSPWETDVVGTAGTDEQVEARRPGRPRDARADEAIIAATLQLLGQGGIAGV